MIIWYIVEMDKTTKKHTKESQSLTEHNKKLLITVSQMKDHEKQLQESLASMTTKNILSSILSLFIIYFIIWLH